MKTIVALVTLVTAGPYVVGALAIAFLLVVACIGILAGLADWFLHYGLPTLGVFVVCVLTLRSLFPRKRRRPAFEVETRSVARDAAIDAELDDLRVELAARREAPTTRVER
ncbi:hypothetical protein [Sandaracinus amylolyticus]|uniref:hypothetical protein n=1 Tax=Sandaracinus amylolyticus TaxID=927083 RepID=UPI001F38C392|nr:hypothetical protein [Sandaracinus amylolyticus]UJR86478.1 Hypothetical protein I5071_85730 [Sandaracinus amylolyticus]